MIKITYLSHIFAIIAIALFYPKMKLESMSIRLFALSVLLNLASVIILIKKKATIKKGWFYTNLLINVFFTTLFTYTVFMLYQLMYG